MVQFPRRLLSWGRIHMHNNTDQKQGWRPPDCTNTWLSGLDVSASLSPYRDMTARASLVPAVLRMLVLTCQRRKTILCHLFMGSKREGTKYDFLIYQLSWHHQCFAYNSISFPEFKKQSLCLEKCAAWLSHLRWCFQMNFSVNMIGKHLGKADINTPVGTRTWKIIPPCTISGCTEYKVSSHWPSYLGLTSAPWDKQTSYRGNKLDMIHSNCHCKF